MWILIFCAIKEGAGETASATAAAVAFQLTEGPLSVLETHPPATIKFNAVLIFNCFDDVIVHKHLNRIFLIPDGIGERGD